MRDTFEEIRQQIHEIRNLWGPFDIKLVNLDHQITEMRVALSQRIEGVESRLLVHNFRFDEQGQKIASLWERVERLELAQQVAAKLHAQGRIVAGTNDDPAEKPAS